MRDGDALLEAAADKADSALSALDGMDARIKQGMSAAPESIKTELESRVRQMLLQNLRRSGIQSRTGKLQNAIANVEVSVNLGRKPKIVIRMPKGISDYAKEDGGGNFYQAAASLNYGAVHGAKGANKREKRKDKKLAQKKERDRTSLGYRVTKAWDFWELTVSQKRELADIAGDIFTSVVLDRSI